MLFLIKAGVTAASLFGDIFSLKRSKPRRFSLKLADLPADLPDRLPKAREKSACSAIRAFDN
jgi:hypothetical protein